MRNEWIMEGDKLHGVSVSWTLFQGKWYRPSPGAVPFMQTKGEAYAQLLYQKTLPLDRPHDFLPNTHCTHFQHPVRQQLIS